MFRGYFERTAGAYFAQWRQKCQHQQSERRMETLSGLNYYNHSIQKYFGAWYLFHVEEKRTRELRNKLTLSRFVKIFDSWRAHARHKARELQIVNGVQLLWQEKKLSAVLLELRRHAQKQVGKRL